MFTAANASKKKNPQKNGYVCSLENKISLVFTGYYFFDQFLEFYDFSNCPLGFLRDARHSQYPSNNLSPGKSIK